MDKDDYYSENELKLSKYEKYKLCKYVLKLLKYCDKDSYDFVKFIWNLMAILDIKAENYKEIVKSNKSNIVQNLNKYINANITKYKTHNSRIENRMNMIANLYSLSEIECEFLKFFILKETIPMFRYFFL